MLQAKLNNGNLITLFQYSKEEIESLRINQHFFCPTCNEIVIIKSGSKTIPHFAHRSITNCQNHEGGEGAYHEKGKLLLFNWLKEQGLYVSLEEYIPSIKQRPDIFIKVKDKMVAIEYQCARIAPIDIQTRTKGYLSEGIQPIWILGGNLFQRTSRNSLKKDHFILQLLHQYRQSKLPLLYFFDPQTSHFLIASSLYEIQRNRMFGNFFMEKLTQIRFTDLFKNPPLPSNVLLKEWKKAKYQFRTHQPKRAYGREKNWYEWLYLNRSHREHLPSIIYLPVPSQYRMITHLWDWQSRICLDIIDPLPIKGVFTLDACQYPLQRSICKDSLPLVKSSGNPILEYLQLLCSLHYIKQLSSNEFIKEKEFIHYTHIEDALVGDNKLMDEISKIFKTKYEHDSHMIRYTNY